MTYAVLFPGQGSQKKGMGRDLLDRYEDLVQEADQILGFSLKDLCLEDPDGKLDQTRYTQPALFAVNAMAWLDLMEKKEALPAFVAGHSLGEYNALVAAGALSFADGLNLVKTRGEVMGTVRNGGMAAVIGLDADQVQAVLDESGLSGLSVANQNTPVQTVISGDREAIEAAGPVFKSRARVRYMVLRVSGAFHAPPMAVAAGVFARAVEGVRFARPRIPVISNVLAAPYPDEDIGGLLCRQMVSRVRWMDSIRYMAKQGVETFMEAGPGKVLTNMLKAIEKAG